MLIVHTILPLLLLSGVTIPARFEIMGVHDTSFLVCATAGKNQSVVVVNSESDEVEVIVHRYPFRRAIMHVPGSTADSLWWRHDFNRLVHFSESKSRAILREFSCDDSFFVSVRPLRCYNNAHSVFLIYSDFINSGYRSVYMLADRNGHLSILDGSSETNWLTYNGDVSPAFGQDFIFLQRDISNEGGTQFVHCRLDPFGIVATYALPSIHLNAWGNITEDSIDFMVDTDYGYLICTYHGTNHTWDKRRYETVDPDICFFKVRMHGDMLYAMLEDSGSRYSLFRIEEGRVVERICSDIVDFELSGDGKYSLVLDRKNALTVYVRASDGTISKHRTLDLDNSGLNRE